MSAIFNFSSLLTVLLLIICTCTYLRELRPTIFDRVTATVLPPNDPNKTTDPPQNNNNPQQQQQQQQQHMIDHRQRQGFTGFLWKMSRIGERMSPYVGAGCAIMACHVLFFQ